MAAGRTERRACQRRPAGPRRLEFRIVELPSGSDPAELVAREGADALRGASRSSVPVTRFLVSGRSAGDDVRSAEGRDRVIEALRPIFAELPDGFLYQELLQLVSDRLGLAARRAGALPARRAAGGPSGRRRHRRRAPEPATAGRPGGASRTPSARSWPAASRSPRRAAPPLDGLDVDALFTSELTRRAAVHLREHFDHPGEALPVDDAELARPDRRARDPRRRPGRRRRRRSRSSACSSTSPRSTATSTPPERAGEPVARAGPRAPAGPRGDPPPAGE